MPRGKPGTGPHARKRYQLSTGYSKKAEAYILLPLAREEAKFLLNVLAPLTGQHMGKKEGVHAVAIIARITEQVIGGE
jgi:hypothetical protein